MFDEIKDYLIFGNLKSATDKINELSETNINSNQRILVEFFKAEIFIIKGEFPEALKILKPFEDKIDNKNMFNYLRFHNLHIEALSKNSESIKHLKN